MYICNVHLSILSILWRQHVCTVYDVHAPANLLPLHLAVLWLHVCWTECTSAEYMGLCNWSYYCIHLVESISKFCQSLKNQDPWLQPRFNRINFISKHIIMRVQCSNRKSHTANNVCISNYKSIANGKTYILQKSIISDVLIFCHFDFLHWSDSIAYGKNNY